MDLRRVQDRISKGIVRASSIPQYPEFAGLSTSGQVMVSQPTRHVPASSANKSVSVVCILCARALLCEQYVSMCIALGGFFFPAIAVLLLSSSFLANHSSKKLQHGICFSVAGALTTSTRTWDMVFPRAFSCIVLSFLLSCCYRFGTPSIHPFWWP